MKPALYIGIDLAPGPGVDLVAESGVEALPEFPPADLVVSCEMLEHAERWTEAFRKMCELAGRKLVLTCRGPGFPYHNPPDHWRFLPEHLAQAALACGLTPLIVQADPQVPGAFLVAERRGFSPSWGSGAHWPTPERSPAPRGAR